MLPWRHNSLRNEAQRRFTSRRESPQDGAKASKSGGRGTRWLFDSHEAGLEGSGSKLIQAECGDRA